MPRIDPERLLKTLAPLLEPESGAIRSNNEVDKIYGLMSKFSKKLVSKCTYINILKATQPEVLDLFLQRGGWDMVLGWTSDAASKNNYDLLKEITGLLLHAPTTIQRLKENELPKVVKSISKDCENEEIRDLAKQVIVKWIAVAKNQESNFPNTSGNTGAHPVPVQSCSITSTKPGVVGVSTGLHTTTAELADTSSFDITPAELNAMIEFNPDDFSKACEQHLGLSEAVASGNAIVHSIDNANVLVDSSDTIKITLNNAHDDIKTPKLSINTPSGEHVEVQADAGAGVIPPSKQTEAPLHCIMYKDGKPFLVRLKLAPPKEITELKNSQEISSTSSGDISPEKKKAKNSDAKDDKQGGTLKTYSKRTPVEVIAALAQTPAETNSKSKKTSDSSEKRHRSNSKGSSLAAAAAAKKAAEEEKLKEKIRQEKANLKKRAKEAAKAKQKQQEKDQETLKQLNLNMEPSVITPPKDNKFNKIPKRQSASSFSDAIGIPGSDSNHKVLKKKSSIDSSSTKTGHNHDSSKVAKKSESSSNDGKDKGTESRRHRPKVFTKKSRGEDLLKDMTETVKISSSKSNKSESSKSIESFGLTAGKSLAGNSLITKPEKRHSIDGIEKGDSKKAKIDGPSSEKKKDVISKPELKKSVSITLQESSMFMDALKATHTMKTVSKKKRRISDNDINDKLSGKSASIIQPPTITSKQSSSSNNDSHSKPASDVLKPVFNFYRETLDDKDPSATETKEPTSRKITSPNSMEEPMDISGDQSELDISDTQRVVGSDDDPDSDSVIPIEEDLSPLKSVLVIHRCKNKPKKSVRWREEEELIEIYTFECDEDERVNVTKHKDFMSMKEHERAEEKEFVVNSLKHGILSDDGEEKMPWRKPTILKLDVVDPVIESQEKDKQEERERLNLGVFLPPGSLLPESGSEPDPASPSDEEKVEPKIIPVEDVMNTTKVYDNRSLLWPRPKADSPFIHQQRVVKPVISPNLLYHNTQPFGMSSNFGDFGSGLQQTVQMPQLRGYSSNGQNQMDFNNPWNTVNSQNPNTVPIGLPNNVNGFPTMSPLTLPSGPIGYPPPTIPNTNPFGIPPQHSLPGMPINFRSVPPPAMGQFIQDQNIAGIPGAATAFNSRGISNNTTSTRDYSDRDFRRPRDQDLRQRDSYDSRGRSRNDHRSSHHDRDRGRDHSRRSPSPPRRRREDRGDRDRDNNRQDKDYRDHDYRRPRSGGKRDVPCRYFAKGHCSSGSRCEFSHEVSQADNSRSASKSDSSTSRRSPNRSPTETWEVDDINSQFERRPSTDAPLIDIADTPASPTNDICHDSSPKIIPVE